ASYAARGRGQVWLDLRQWRAKPLWPKCGCMFVKNGTCVHALMTLDAILQQVHGEPSEQLKRLSDTLAVPAWVHLLTSIVQGLQQKAEDEKDHLLSWRIETSGDAIYLHPYLHKPLKRGGYSAGSRIDAWRVLHEERLDLKGKDLQVARMLAANPGSTDHN